MLNENITEYNRKTIIHVRVIVMMIMRKVWFLESWCNSVS